MLITSGPSNKCFLSHTNSTDSRVRHVAFTNCRNSCTDMGGGTFRVMKIGHLIGDTQKYTSAGERARAHTHTHTHTQHSDIVSLPVFLWGRNLSKRLVTS
jgi:hypothetical protein